MKSKIILGLIVVAALVFFLGINANDESAANNVQETIESEITSQEDANEIVEEAVIQEQVQSGEDQVEEIVEEGAVEPDQEQDSTEGDSMAIEKNMSVARQYFDAVAHEDLDEFLSVFSDDAVVRVVSRDLDTQERLTAFATREVFGGVYEIYRAEHTERGIRILLQFTPEGWSSPEPVAIYDFAIAGDQITDANLQYASAEDLAYFNDKTLEGTALIPSGFAKYLEGVVVDDGAMIASGFTPEGEVMDVNRLISGQEAIESWANREVLRLKYRVGKIVYREDGALLIVHIQVGESSSNWYATYDLTLDNENIEYADLQYADEELFNY